MTLGWCPSLPFSVLWSGSMKAQQPSPAHSEGVRSVGSPIKVLPLAGNDDQIRRAAFRAIHSKPTLPRYAEANIQQIHVIVKNGNVTLEGAAASPADKHAAQIFAHTVARASAAPNNLQVTGGGT
jgi:osmotically-inducible protein OsmY